MWQDLCFKGIIVQMPKWVRDGHSESCLLHC